VSALSLFGSRSPLRPGPSDQAARDGLVGEAIERRRAVYLPRVAARTVGLIASMGVFMAFFDNTVVGIAFPNLLASFPHAGIGGLSWILNAYGIVFAALLVPAGCLADLVGRRRLFSAGVVLFTLSSLLCAVSPNVATLIAARALQGAGAAILVPASLALVLEANPGRSRAMAVTAWSATAVLAAGIGPSVGGLLVNLSGWRLVFLVNVPIGVVVWRLSARKLVESRAPGRGANPDLPGSLLLAMAVGALVVAIVQSDAWGPFSPAVLACVVAAVAGAAALVRRSRHHQAPVLDLALLRRRTFAVTSGLTIVGSIGFYAAGLANLLYLMEVWRYSPLEAGLAFTPAPFAAAVSAVLAGRWAAGRDARPLLVAGSVLWTAAPLWLAIRGGTHPAFLDVYLPSALVGAVGIGLTFPVISDVAVAEAPGRRFAAATALNTGIRELGAAIGIAICVALLDTHASSPLVPFHRIWYFAAACFVLLGAGAMFSGRIEAPRSAASADDVEQETVHNGAGRRPAASVPASHSPEPVKQSGPGALEILPPDVLACAHRVQLAAGEWLFRQGEVGDSLYVVERGRIEVVAEAPGSDAEVLCELGPGAVVGELALISGAPRSASVRGRRDTTLLCLPGEDFEEVVKLSPDFSRALLRHLARQLEKSRPAPRRGRDPASVVALFTAGRDAESSRAIALFSKAFVDLGNTVLLDPRVGADRLAEALEQIERRHTQVLLLAGAPGTDWAASCARQADRVVLVVGEAPAAGHAARAALPRGADAALAGPVGDPAVTALLAEIGARSSQRIRPGADGGRDAAALARRVTGRSVGLVLSGGGARGFAHIGVIEELLAAGIAIDRVAGASMGAFIGAQLAAGVTPEEIDRRCYEEWVRRNPTNDYRLPRVSLIRGARVLAMLERVLPATFEDLVRPFLCVSTDLIRAELVSHRRGDLRLAVAASMSLPAFAPPVRLDGRLLCDGGLIDNLPIAAMAAEGEGPIIACDVGEPMGRHVGRVEAPEHDPTLPETLYHLVLMRTEDTLAAARRHARLVILPERDGVGRLDFYQLDRMREQGRRAAARALETAPPELFGR
jgi:EmrB/QacA subfamily drug resistance transporter